MCMGGLVGAAMHTDGGAGHGRARRVGGVLAGVGRGQPMRPWVGQGARGGRAAGVGDGLCGRGGGRRRWQDGARAAVMCNRWREGARMADGGARCGRH